MATASGVLLTVRELCKDGLGWPLKGKGVCAWTKVLVMVAGILAARHEVALLSTVLPLGILGSELPDRVRENRLFR